MQPPITGEPGKAPAWKRIIVTHHLPSVRSIPVRFSRSPLNPAFALDLEALITVYQPDLWIHGHTHDACDYRLGDTRVVCNPRGYPGEQTGFDAALLIEV